MQRTGFVMAMLSSVAVGSVMVVLAAEPCLQPHWSLSDYGFTIDPNMIAGHPIAPIVCEAGVPTVVVRRACDLEGDGLGPIEVLYPPSGVQVAIVDDTTYQVRIAMPTVGTSYITLMGWDAPDPNIAEPNSTVVTIPVQTVLRHNSGPILY